MKITTTELPGVLVLEPKVFGDARGFFMESFNQKLFDELSGTRHQFVQDNHSRSARGVLRGLHYQLPPHAQGKLVRVTQGSVFDVAVDIRRGSPSLGRWVGVELSGENHRQLWIPPGFAHGFLTLEPDVEVLYKVSAPYAPSCDRAIRFDDPALAIAWPLAGATPILSDKDRKAPLLAEAAHELSF